MKKAADIIFNPGEEYSEKNRRWQGTPSIEKTGNRLWASWFTGGNFEPDVNNYAVLAYSDDDGETWTDPYMVVKCNIEDHQRVCDLQLWLAPNGRLWAYWCQDVFPEHITEADFETYDQLWEEFLNNTQCWYIYTDNPEDETPIWSEPAYHSQGYVRNKPTVLKTGTLFIPGYSVKKEGKYQYIIGSDFNKDIEIKEGPVIVGKKNYDECMALQREDGSIWFLVRTMTGYLAESSSYDYGETWTETKLTEIPNPCTRFNISRLKNGMVLLVNTPSAKLGDRTGLVASLSMDDGKTWSYHLRLEDRRSTTYPDVALGEDGSIYVAYDCQRDNRQLPDPQDSTKSIAAKEICMAKFTVEDIMEGKFVNPNSYTRKIISKVNFSERFYMK